ncbi:Cilia- and flagella-associated protein 298 [Trypanosoma melophagium]|uniref:Cilia- and flagella-associated protein 298 n=1 Tax=Trypanosoma melophagium TaxID=715481 RepID=UPI00351A1D30|nr:Cilia- and flagella-associated protein 298 [Trypanosoma melophagium]
MVLLTVKGTTFPDEFIYECTTSTPISSELAQQLCHIQSTRHQVKLQLLSARELMNEAKQKQKVENMEDDNKNNNVLSEYERVVEEVSTRLKDKITPVTLDEFDHFAEKLRELTERLFPEECTAPNGGDRTAAVEHLYALHDNPDIDEDRRLVIYHCRAILDTQWKRHEMQQEEKAGLWFCGKLMEGEVAKYSGKNEKSRLTVKVHPRDAAPPAMEPRMSYDDQRALFERMRERRETYKTLETSELRERVLAQARGKVLLDAPNTASGVNLDASRLRPINPKKEERELV